MSKENLLSFLGSLSSKMCHDLIAPLSAVNMGIELLEEQLTDDILEDSAFLLVKENIVKSIERINFFRYAFAFSKTDSVPSNSEFLQICKHACIYYKIDFTLEHYELPPYEQASHLRLLTCFLYLLIDTLPKGGRIKMSVLPSVTTISAEGPTVLENTSIDLIHSHDRLDITRPQTVIPELIKAGLKEFHLSLKVKHDPGSIHATFISTFIS
jgi:hypothetical protein